MKEFWKWVERIVWVIAIVSFQKGWDVVRDIIPSVKQFWSSFTPWQFLFFLSVIILLYRLVRFLVDIYRISKAYKGFRLDTFPGTITDLKEQINSLAIQVERLKEELSQDLEPRINKLEEPAKTELLRKTIFSDKKE